MFIYKTTNTINNKVYVGQTCKFSGDTYFGSGFIVMRAIKKYGKENFIREILEFCSSKDQLNDREIYWIKYFSANTRDIGYNVSIGGNGGNLGDEVNKIIRIRLKEVGYNYGNKSRTGMKAYNKGVPMSEEQKAKLRKPKTEEHKKRLSEIRTGKCIKPIRCLNNNKVYPGSLIAAKELGLTVPNIVEVLKGRAKATKGYVFEYVIINKI